MRAGAEVRHAASVVGPGRPGFLKVEIATRRGGADRIVEVAADRVPTELHIPNTQVVLVTGSEGVLRVEAGARARARLEVDDAVRRVLCTWDPIGVADEVDDEYDSYIGGVLDLLRARASDRALAEHLLTIERDSMGLPGSAMERLLVIAATLREVRLSPDDDT